MMSNLNEVPRSYLYLSYRCWDQLSRRRLASSLLCLTLHDCDSFQNNQKLRSFRILYIRAVAQCFLLQSRRLPGYVPKRFGFNGGVEFLITPFEGESHGRFIPVIGE